MRTGTSAPIALALLAPLLVSAHAVEPSPDLGTAEAGCRPAEAGPAVIVSVEGLKDRRGILRLELYPPDDADFLADDAKLVNAGRTFRRLDVPVPPAGPVRLCMRLPEPGTWALVLLHDRDSNLKFNGLIDGAGFAGNPRLGLSRPKAEAARFVAGPELTRLTIRLNYWRGFSFGPLRKTH
jgi:uncharacterized protein (DUF2141 family)